MNMFLIGKDRDLRIERTLRDEKKDKIIYSCRQIQAIQSEKGLLSGVSRLGRTKTIGRRKGSVSNCLTGKISDANPS